MSLAAALSEAPAEAVAASAEAPIVSLRNLSVAYRNQGVETRVIENLDLSVQRGEFIAVLGPSGCGKSTLLKVLSGLITPVSGTALFQGKPIMGPHRDVGVVFQAPTLLPWKTVLENVKLPGRIMRLDRKWTEERARFLLDLVGLTAFSNALPHHLSGGMAQRVGIARGLLQDPPLLLMDEPFGALDAMTRERLNLQLAEIWAKTGKTIIFITHSITEAAFLADRVVVMAPRPTHVEQIIDIDIPHPRAPSIMATPEFGNYTERLREFFEAVGAL